MKTVLAQVIHMDQPDKSVNAHITEAYELQRRFNETASSIYGPVMMQRQSMRKRYNDIRHTLAVRHSLIIPDIESW